MLSGYETKYCSYFINVYHRGQNAARFDLINFMNAMDKAKHAAICDWGRNTDVAIFSFTDFELLIGRAIKMVLKT